MMSHIIGLSYHQPIAAKNYPCGLETDTASPLQSQLLLKTALPTLSSGSPCQAAPNGMTLEAIVDKKRRPQHTPSPGAAKDACTLERLVIFFKSVLHWQYVTRVHTF